jgi:hypothetical protein
METTEARSAFATLFAELYGVPQPVLPLGRVLHWADVVRRLGQAGSVLDRTPTYLFGGYFYNTSTPVPSAAVISAALEAGAALGARQYFVPTIRNHADAGALSERGFQCIPWVIESIFEVEHGLDDDLARRVGRRRFKYVKRVSAQAAVGYPARFYESHAIQADPGLLDTAAALHYHNVVKYQHALNFYSAPLLRRLWTSPIGEHLLLCLRYDATTGEAVQASISLIDRRRKQMYQLVHGVDREKVSPEYNLFVATTYDEMAYAQGLGIRTINLGRGAADEKRRVGANRFNLLNCWILTPSPDAGAEVAILAARSREALGIVAGQMPMIGAFPVE